VRRTRGGRERTTPPPAGYWEVSREPLEILAFLLPLLVIYELGLAWWLRSGPHLMANKAHGGLVDLFRMVGVRAEDLGLPLLSLPMVGLVLTLVVWHVLRRRPWRVDLGVVGGMAVESAVLCVPLLPLGMLVSRWGAGMSAPDVGDGGTLSRVAMAAGAGIYEELVFRLALMSAIHMLLSDVGGWRGPGSWIASAAAAAVAFALYHPLQSADGGFATWRFLFLVAGGCWFGLLFHWRGFGIAAGTHAAYDLMALLLWR
jgi:hypothetical protein